MVRIELYSADRKLQQLLSSALGKEFQITLEADAEAIIRSFSAGECDVVVVDLDSNHVPLQDRIAGSERIIASKISPVLLTDDGLRSTALELVRQGAHNFKKERAAFHGGTENHAAPRLRKVRPEAEARGRRTATGSGHQL